MEFPPPLRGRGVESEAINLMLTFVMCQVAEAPKVRSNKVQDIAELEDDEMFRLPASEDRDIDLSLLTAVLCSSEQVYEIDEVWDQDTLFTQVASELHLEMDRAEGSVGEGKETEGGAAGALGQISH